MTTVSSAAPRVPSWFPAWAVELTELYFSGSTSMFVLHGNVDDFVALDAESSAYGTLIDFLAEQVFGRWDLVLYYDLARGLRAFAGRDADRLKTMVAEANKRVGDLAASRKDPATAFALLDRFVQNNVMAADQSLRCAILIGNASYLAPSGEPGRLSPNAAQQVVTLLNWAASPQVKQLNMATVLIDESAQAMSERLLANPYVSDIELPMPVTSSRLDFLRHVTKDRDFVADSDYTVEQVAQATAGITLVDLNVLVRSILGSPKRLDAQRMRELKKDLIERQCRGLLEFIEPKWTLDNLIGHEPVKKRLREDAQLLKSASYDALPMGYLASGPVGTGKTFLAQCMAGEMGAPCVMLKNFRSKYVGETEGNLQHVLGVLRAMGPVVVVIDEADAALGNREQDGDSGTSSRVFSMIASQMGDTKYRGRIIWMLLTCRPDLLPIDLKRQGRAEVHFPLFYPSEQAELRAMFVSMARKAGLTLKAEDVPDVQLAGKLSGADIEGIMTRAARRALIEKTSVDKSALERELAGFLPSVEGLEKEMQEIAAMLECTELEFLPEPQRDRISQPGARSALQQRFLAIKAELR